LDLYLSEEPLNQILEVEEAMIVPIATSEGEILERPLVAVADLITLEDGKPKVTEFKTSSRSYSDSVLETSLQATCYTYAAEEVYGMTASVEYVVFVKTKVPKLQRQPAERSSDSFGRIGDLVQMIERAVDSEVFYPNESTINCSNCCYRKQCKEWPNRIDPNISFERDKSGELVRC
jgi:CRISPR/Cas system-associated exonuclease Cas4 (RecB family)